MNGKISVDKSKLLLYLLLYTSVDTVLFGTNSSYVFNLVPRFVAIIVIIILMLKKPMAFIHVRKGEIVALLIMCLTVVLSGVTNSTAMPTIVTRIIMIYVAYCVTKTYKLKEFIEIFISFMYYVCLVAIFFEIIAYIIPNIIYKLPVVVNTASKAYATLGVGSISFSTLNSALKRANGIFWEPGAFSIYCSIAIIFALFYKKKINRKHIVIIFIGFLLAFSTTGTISMCVFLTFWILSNDKVSTQNSHKKELLICCLMVITCFIIWGEALGIHDLIFGKITNGESTSVTRIASVVNSIQIIKDYPFLGIGQNNMREFMAIYASNTVGFELGANPMNTNTTLFYFASYGIFFGIIFVIGLFKLSKKIGHTLFMGIGIFTTIILLFCGETFYSFFPFLLVFYGWSKQEVM